MPLPRSWLSIATSVSAGSTSAVAVSSSTLGVNQILVETSGQHYCVPMTSPAAGPYAGAECIGDGIGNHGNNERCEISVRFNAILTAVECMRTPILEWPRSPPSEPHDRQTSVRLATLQMMWRPVVTT